MSHNPLMGQFDATDVEELRDRLEAIKRGMESLNSSLPFQPPEAIGFQWRVKVLGPLAELDETVTRLLEKS